MAEAAGRYSKGNKSAAPVLIQTDATMWSCCDSTLPKRIASVPMATKVLSGAEQTQLFEGLRPCSASATAARGARALSHVLDELERVVAKW